MLIFSNKNLEKFGKTVTSSEPQCTVKLFVHQIFKLVPTLQSIVMKLDVQLFMPAFPVILETYEHS